MISPPDRIYERRHRGVLLSLITHAALLAFGFLLMLDLGRVHPIYHESRCCTAALYWTGSAGSGHSRPEPSNHIRRLKTPPTSILPPVDKPVLALRETRAPQPPPVVRRALADTGAVTRTQQQTMIGTGTGTENAEPAFPVYYPTPVVSDRSLLPAVEQKIIVNVTISAQGDVTEEKLVQGLGNGLDDLVLQTVKTWRFQPATLNGTATASVEELVFPFNRDYPDGSGQGS